MIEAATQVPRAAARSDLAAGMRWLPVTSIVVLTLIGCLVLAALLNIWVDEAYSLHTASGSFARTLHQALFWDFQPPVYFLALNAWTHLSDSLLFARAFSVLSICAALFAVAALARRLVPGIHPAWIVGAMALNPFIVSIAIEIRVYALAVLLSALLLLFFYDGFIAEPPSSWARVLYVLVAVAALYTQYYLGFLLAANALALMALRRWGPLRTYLFGMLAVAACAAPIAFILRYQIAANSLNFSSHFSLSQASFQLAKVLSLALLPVGWLPEMFKALLIGLCGVVAALLLLAATRETKKWQMGLPIAITVFASALFVAALTLAQQPITLRYAAGLFLPALLSVYAIIASAGRFRNLALLSWTALYVACAGMALYLDYRPIATIGDWKRVATFIVQHESRDQAILVYEPQAALPLSYYYHGSNALVPIPRDVDFQRYDLHELTLSDASQISSGLARVPGHHRFVWLVTTSGCRRVPIDFRCEILDQYVQRNYDVRLSADFFESHVRLLERRAGTTRAGP